MNKLSYPNQRKQIFYNLFLDIVFFRRRYLTIALILFSTNIFKEYSGTNQIARYLKEL